MKTVIFFLILNSIAFVVYGQNSVNTDSFVQQYEHKTIFLKRGGFEKDGQFKPHGFLKKNLKKELTASPLALQEYKRSRTNHWLTTGCTLAGIALQLSGAQRIAFKKEIAYSGVGFNLLAIPFKIKSKHQLNHAIWLYNKDAMRQ